MSRLILLPLIAATALLLSRIEGMNHMGLSALPLAILLGIIAAHTVRRELSDTDHKVTQICQKRCLRLGIILFGLSLNFQQIASVGFETVVLNIIVISAVVSCGIWLGMRMLKLPFETAILISAGSAICGAAAVLAAESAVKARQQQVTVAVATVVLFGTLAMFVYPLIYPHVAMSEQAFGIYIGSTVHEVAQAVAAGQAISPAALDQAVVTKLIRVMLLAPFILVLGLWMARRQAKDQGVSIFGVIPWFVLGFVCMAGINSVFELPEWALSVAAYFSQFLLALAMAALGVQTHFSLIRQAGIRPVLMASGLFVLLIVGGLFLNLLLIG